MWEEFYVVFGSETKIDGTFDRIFRSIHEQFYMIQFWSMCLTFLSILDIILDFWSIFGQF